MYVITVNPRNDALRALSKPFYLSMKVPYAACKYVRLDFLLSVSACMSEMKATGVGYGFTLAAGCALLPSCHITARL